MASVLYSPPPLPSPLNFPSRNSSPVHLELIGSQSCCYLKPIDAPKIKETLAQVTAAFRDRPVISLLSATLPNKEKDDEINQLVLKILGFVKDVLKYASGNTFQLKFSDVVGLFLENVEDRTFETRRAFSISIVLSENAVKESTNAGLIFYKMNSVTF